IAHDLRAPLITLDGFTQVLLENHADRLDEVGRAHLTRICGSARRMHRLINDLLELSKVVRAPMHVTTLDLSCMAREVAARLRDSAPERTATIVIAPEVRLEGDAHLWKIALEQLLANAWKFTSKIAHPCIEFGSRIDR